MVLMGADLIFPVSLLAWFLVHKLVPFVPAVLAMFLPAPRFRRFQASFTELSQTKKDYFCRLARSQIYYVWATVAGTSLLSKVRSVHDLLFLWSDEHHFCFTIGVTSWIVACWEDYKGRAHLTRGAQIDQIREKGTDHDVQTWDGAMQCAFASHHILTIFAYSFILGTGTLSSLGAFGKVRPA